MSLRGKECKTMNEFWGGPFFDDDSKYYDSLSENYRRTYVLLDRIFRKDLIRGGKKLTNTVTELAGDEKDTFLDLASSML